MATATDGVHQVGQIYFQGVNRVDAVLWSGTAKSAVDLGPTKLPEVNSSVATGVGGGQEVGYGFYTSPFIGAPPRRALLWSGTADSAVDLHPTDIGDVWESFAIATNGVQQVGFYWRSPDDPSNRALMWSGTAGSAVDLDALLPSGFTSSIADSVDAAGNVFGAAVDASGHTHAIEWVRQVPEPASGALVALTAAALAQRRTHD